LSFLISVTSRLIKIIVAIGANEPLGDQLMMADYFHGIDGLGGIHATHPHFTPSETWRELFKTALSSKNPDEVQTAKALETSNSLFTPSQKPAHEEILRILRENERDTITIVAVGPMTNLARAAAADPEAFLRVKEICVMGGSIEHPGNVGRPSLINPVFPCPPFSLIRAPPSNLRTALNIRNQVTPVAGMSASLQVCINRMLMIY
jgi:inosine-uridine nucleoside N-ribohydrolase